LGESSLYAAQQGRLWRLQIHQEVGIGDLDLPSMNLSTTLTVPARGQIVFSPEAQWNFPYGYSGTAARLVELADLGGGFAAVYQLDVEVSAVEAFDESHDSGSAYLLI